MQSSDKIHDLLAIGELEAALSLEPEQESEIDRLPLLLRYLAAGQPLSTVPHVFPLTLRPDPSADPFVDAVVTKLENVAATHSAAESIDVLVTHLAPSITRRISKLESLKRKSPDGWLTSELAATALAPLSNMRNKKSRLNSISRASMNSLDSDDNLEEGSCDEMEDIDSQPQVIPRDENENLSQQRPGGRESFLAGMPEDSAEAHLTRVLGEVASLVVDSLQPPLQATKEEQEEALPERSLAVKADSLLSDSDTTMVGGNDLAACLVALMFHAPVLRHQHVASAFCRASVPQSSSLIYRMGANSPSAVPCLIRGCLDAVATEGSSESIVSIAKESVRKLAKLSPREASRVQGMLQSSMPDVHLELALEQDTVAAACFLIKTLSKGDSLRQVLQTNLGLVSKCYGCLINRINALKKSSSGEIKLLLRAFAWLILSVPTAKTESLLNAVACMNSILVKYACSHETGIIPDRSDEDSVLLLGLPTSLLLCTVLALPCSQEEVIRNDAWQSLLKSLLSSKSPSLLTQVFLSRIAALLHAQELKLLLEMMKETLASADIGISDACLQDGFLKLCKWAVIKANLDYLCNNALAANAAVLDPAALLQLVHSNYADVGSLKSIIRDILNNAVASSKLVKHVLVSDLLTAVITYTSKCNEQDLPLVSQVTLSSLFQKAAFADGSERRHLAVSHLALNFLYAVIFSAENSTSPFSFDPRDQPVVEILQLMKEMKLLSAHERAISILRKQVPDLICESELSYPTLAPVLEISNESQLSRQDVSKLLASAIRETVDCPEFDPSGLRVERTYVLARKHMPSSQVDCLVVQNLMALSHSPAPFLTYVMLCRDPLIVLQLPLSLWLCRGIRRVAFSVLGRLLLANDNLARLTSPSEEVAEELLTSRNVVILRSLLSLATGYFLSQDVHTSHRLTKPPHCHFLTGAIRKLVSCHKGVLAILIKHGLPDEVVDWLVDFVPECVNDASTLAILLSDASSLSSAERLKTADAALRIAIAFGSRDEGEAKILVGACLYQLITSLYIVLGPVGVPVNAVVEESGMDLTKVCRKTTFRILSALQKIRGSRTGLKSECSLALQKLASMCKAETSMSGLSGVVANRRKMLLKEIWDALVKALNGMGSGISLN